ncbi:hypothetical protein [Hydrogenophaga sp.]|uniref:hypothetical protein n=1 Tax=Hydrogenophaga sp. TaxID=1904254 RepID=UPI002730ED4B|nr:hypothetical protein [Hydrogenophaga sp.]MDP1686851.1 hypothetical protein [Hydrogenophaga sp.]
MSTPHITQMREHLMETLASLRDRANPMEPDRARAIAQVASVLVDTAKVEVDYIKATGADRSDFLEMPATAPGLPNVPEGPAAHNPFPTTTVHRLRG